ncbi:GNAT family N-acetyltransferase [Vibrio sp. SCSIO 43153]|uniref:GNAT family N-acetyltransferase n=1 Tax=Vibrio sp. SCSIO 43153 TaxID=2819098 RepID=UPI0020765E2E|nr:GNAT family N-acetyltransferase [Vibrio sp. SCSIO 43153]USD51786.1 GNAT family N-acetyltransferase [Vibrio sp. SCSIO 43153]
MQIVKANLSHLEAFKQYVEKCAQVGMEMYVAAQSDSEALLEKRIGYAKGEGLPEGWTPSLTYFCIEQGVILGSIRVRDGNNDYLENVIGHIGYETAPDAQGKGIATFMLNWVKAEVLEGSAIVTCDVNNIASRRVIEKAGGEFLNTFYSEQDQYEVRRYRVIAG